MNPTPFNLQDDQLNLFYGERWQTRDTSLDQYDHSGYILGEQVRAGEHVIHINCGSHPFKGMIANLRGVDPTNPKADYRLSLQDYANAHKASKFNVALCLNAFDTGTPEYITSQVALVIQLMVKRDARIYWRTAMNSFWNLDRHIALANQFNYHIAGSTPDANDTLYVEWDSNLGVLSLI
jgi:hypothetical protein